MNEANPKLEVVETVCIHCRNCGSVPLSKSDEKIFFSSGAKLSGKCPICGRNPLKIFKKQKSLSILEKET